MATCLHPASEIGHISGQFRARLDVGSTTVRIHRELSFSRDDMDRSWLAMVNRPALRDRDYE